MEHAEPNEMVISQCLLHLDSECIVPQNDGLKLSRDCIWNISMHDALNLSKNYLIQQTSLLGVRFKSYSEEEQLTYSGEVLHRGKPGRYNIHFSKQASCRKNRTLRAVLELRRYPPLISNLQPNAVFLSARTASQVQGQDFKTWSVCLCFTGYTDYV